MTVFVAGLGQREWVVQGTKAEAKTFEAKKRVELEASRLSTRVSPSFTDFCESVYAPHAVRELRDSTWSQVRVYQIQNLSEFFGKLKLVDISVEKVERYKHARLDEVAASTVNNELRVLGRIMRYAIELGYPCAKPEWKRAKQKNSGRVIAWSTEQVAKLFAATESTAPELLDLLTFLVNTGCRKGEAIACEWSWVDLRRGLLRIPANDVWRPKDDEPREVPLSDPLMALLGGERRHERFVFPNRHGEQYARFPEEQWRACRDAAGLSGGVHQLRHTYASHFLEKVPDLRLLAEVLGHSSTRVTELYAHLLPGHLDRAKNAVQLAPASLAATLAKARKKRRNKPETATRH